MCHGVLCRLVFDGDLPPQRGRNGRQMAQSRYERHPNSSVKGPGQHGQPPIRTRRSLTHVGGAVETEGDPADIQKLEFALQVRPSTDQEDDLTRAHVHGFHSYPARMHPVTAHRLARGFTPMGGRLLDPFCGSGTVLVESMLLGLKPTGFDLNPLAVRLARCKTTPRTDGELNHMVGQASECAAFADDRRKTKAGASRRFGAEDVALFEPHVLLELDSLLEGIRSLGRDPARTDLELVLSSLLVKLSRRQADTSKAVGTRRLAAGHATRQFLGKARELARRLAEFRGLLPSAAVQPAKVKQGNATLPAEVPAGPFDAVVTSPPYAATYDYIEHHALRLRWLGLDTAALEHGELGARSRYNRMNPQIAGKEWVGELTGFLRAMCGVLKPGSPLVLMMADSALGQVALRADELVAEAARASGFKPAARASQARPHFHGPSSVAFRQRPRQEHAIVLRKA